MNAPQRVPLNGWKSWEKRRRRELRATRGISLSQASRTALHEVRCRARIAEVVGRPAAKALRLVVCQGSPYEDPQFLLAPPIEYALWLRLADIPGLIRAIEEPSE